jgi:hypothetical protein
MEQDNEVNLPGHLGTPLELWKEVLPELQGEGGFRVPRGQEGEGKEQELKGKRQKKELILNLVTLEKVKTSTISFTLLPHDVMQEKVQLLGLKGGNQKITRLV